MPEPARAAARSITLEVLRYRPEIEAAPVWQSYVVPFSEDLSVLQALQHVKDELDGSLSFRWSCRMAICGSCGMMIDGRPRLACQTFLRELLPGPVRLEALAHWPIQRDLVIDASGFIAGLERIKPYLIPRQPRPLAAGEYRQSPHELELFEPYSACINCLLCYAACPQFGLDPGFTGPGLLALLHRYNADSRDGGRAQRMAAVNAEHGVWSCTAVGYCSEVCPKAVDPAHAVNQNKVNSAIDYLRHLLAPRGAPP